jgi:uncharacterized protein (TIGR02996 family)
VFSPQELALLDAIHTALGDDAPRLAYADWLAANGQEQYAAFLRLQCKGAPALADMLLAEQLGLRRTPNLGGCPPT